MQYIIILVDKREKDMVDSQSETVKVQYIVTGTQMVGLRFKHSRPTVIIDCIQNRSYKNYAGEESFDKWFTHCVLPNSKNAQYIRHK